ncbi:MAG: PhnD/SsuA/transferrin family substrate-binding protein, partial [Acidimicrobiia bacterium]|nr:PhnD/SsuA/transferrin family substrate-binding protein [Acidimicrobiia bacterium]
MILTTLLAENADEILAATSDRLGASFDRSLSWNQRLKGATSGTFDGVWVCGLLGMRLLHSGDLTGQVGAAPVFQGRNKAVYQSVVVARHGSGYASLADVAGAVLALNDYGSWSGYGALAEHLQSHRRSIDLFSRQVETGSHMQSIDAVRQRLADVAAIDHTVWDWAADRGQTDGLVVIDRSSPWPAPPLITRNPEVAKQVIGTDMSDVSGI